MSDWPRVVCSWSGKRASSTGPTDKCPGCGQELETVGGPMGAEYPAHYRDGDPITAASRLGHRVESDPPAAITSVQRWTCTNPGCGRAVLLSGNGHLYGSAIEQACPASQEG